MARCRPERREAALVDLVINIRLAEQGGEAAGLETEPAVMRRLDLARDRTLYSEYLRTKFIAAVTDDAVQARFDEELAAFVPQDEVRARHILVKTEDEAKAIIAKLDAGGDFAELATEDSLDPGSGQSGGDLGFFRRGQMVKPFEEAAFGLKPGKYTKKPVQSDFGWHVILVEEKREEPPPTFESQAQRIQQELIRATFDAEIEDAARGRHDRTGDGRAGADAGSPGSRRAGPGTLGVAEAPRPPRPEAHGPVTRMTAVSPLAPTSFPALPPIAGVRFATAEAGIKHAGRTDVLLAVFDKGTTVAGVFTRSKCPSAPVDWCRAALESGKARALLVNSGNANAFTGKRGRETVKLSAAMVAEALGCRPREVFLASTGVIGEPLDAAKFDRVVERLVAHQHDGPWIDAARAIMTTDTFPKVATRTAWIGDAAVAINGIAKGAGMIAPDMATMLSFVFTDAPIAAPVLQSLLSRGVTGSFNAITVDSDTSTSDTLLLFATGQVAGARPITRRATGGSPASARRSTRCSSTSPIRWCGTARGRGNSSRCGSSGRRRSARPSGSRCRSPIRRWSRPRSPARTPTGGASSWRWARPASRPTATGWRSGSATSASRSTASAIPTYSEAVASAYMKSQDIVITVDIGLGKGSDRVWTCDLTKEYVAINGDYRS